LDSKTEVCVVHEVLLGVLFEAHSCMSYFLAIPLCFPPCVLTIPWLRSTAVAPVFYSIYFVTAHHSANSSRVFSYIIFKALLFLIVPASSNLLPFHPLD
ncbi:hypothetical protein B0H13DRAFT_1968376, partial [Mycena leptocephala]